MELCGDWDFVGGVGVDFLEIDRGEDELWHQGDARHSVVVERQRALSTFKLFAHACAWGSL